MTMTTTEKDFLDWWERTWREKEQILSMAYGDARVENVIAYEWKDIDVRIPGGCALEFTPSLKSGSRHVALSFGLSQPSGPENVQGPDAPSGDGYEIAFATQSAEPWKIDLIGEVLTYLRQTSASLGRGHRLPLWFSSPNKASLGKPEKGDTPFGKMRWMLVWPDLKHAGGFDSSTGFFNVYFCTTITNDEWAWAKSTSSAHLMLLLCESKVFQTSFADRDDVVKSKHNEGFIQRISQLAVQEVERELFERFSG